MLKKAVFFLAILSFITFPLIVQASGTYKIKVGDKEKDVCYEGLVPCGKCVTIGGSLEKNKCLGTVKKFVPCTLCHAFTLIHDAVNFFIFNITLPIAVLMIIVGGILYLVGGNNPQQIALANRIFYNTFLGLVIIFGAFILIGTFLSLIGVAEWTGLGANQWFKINCPIQFSNSDWTSLQKAMPCY
jgi:hypothetical protein